MELSPDTTLSQFVSAMSQFDIYGGYGLSGVSLQYFDAYGYPANSTDDASIIVWTMSIWKPRSSGHINSEV